MKLFKARHYSMLPVIADNLEKLLSERLEIARKISRLTMEKEKVEAKLRASSGELYGFLSNCGLDRKD